MTDDALNMIRLACGVRTLENMTGAEYMASPNLYRELGSHRMAIGLFRLMLIFNLPRTKQDHLLRCKLWASRMN